MEHRNNRFRRKYFAAIDRLLIRLAVTAVILLFVVQALHLHAETRKHLSLVDNLEGEQITAPTTMYGADISRVASIKLTTIDQVIAKSIRSLRFGQGITIRMITPLANRRDALLTVNGQAVGNFSRGEVEVTVYDGDYIEIDAAKLTKPAQFIIDTHKSDMILPIDGTLLDSQSAIVVVGKVVYKH